MRAGMLHGTPASVRRSPRGIAGLLKVDPPLWATSTPAHLANPKCGARLSGVVAGHIVQLFDTGLECDVQQRDKLRTQLTHHRLPCRIGVGGLSMVTEAAE